MGDDSVAKTIIRPVLHYYGIEALDALIITHQDTDHSAGMADLLRHGTPLIYANQAIHLNHHLVDQPLTMHIPNGSIHMMPPSMLFPDESSNNRSLLVHVTLASVSFLMSGDMDESMELQLLRHHRVPRVNVLKLGHHGSRFSTSPEWLRHIQPLFIWNSAGKNNRYGHPHPSVLNRLNSWRIPWLSTHQNGAIQMNVKKNQVSIITKQPKITRFLYLGDE